MAKTTVNNIIAKMKRRFDYNITDTALDTLLLDCINDANKLIYQWLINAGFYNDTIGETTISTVANQSYVDTSSTTIDTLIALYERTNDTYIDIIPYSEFVKVYPDPTNTKSSTPTHAAIANNKIYLAPTPTAIITLYPVYGSVPADLALGGTLLFPTKYDPLVLAVTRTEYLRWHDANNTQAINSAEASMEYYKKELITNAHRGGIVRQSESYDTSTWLMPKIKTT